MGKKVCLMCSGPLASPTREFLARRVVDALERVERGEPEEQDESEEDDHVLVPVRPDVIAAEPTVIPVRREQAAQRRLFSRREPKGTFHLRVRAVELFFGPLRHRQRPRRRPDGLRLPGGRALGLLERGLALGLPHGLLQGLPVRRTRMYIRSLSNILGKPRRVDQLLGMRGLNASY